MELLTPDFYKSAAEKIFQTVRTDVLRILPHARVEHVGSSAIPGALSKGDIDICVVVGEGLVSVAATSLMKLGYVEKLDTLRTKQLCMLVALRKDVEVALQVIEAGSQFEFFIKFRDALVAESTLVDEYNCVKKASAHLSDDAYREAKSLFIEAVLLRLSI